ncbi:MAG TPA: hypothetical protein VKD72_26455 [Gemmataceae bacterium]|nr:hypothetical protein [Gemmataceae bacterium]
MNGIPSLATILDDGTRSINWFNGRLVTAEAMTQDRKAIREGLRSLGRTMGEGIVFGLEVSETLGSSTASKPVVTITAGLAINGHGDVLRLCANADVPLLGVQPAELPTSANGFENCLPPQPGVYVAGEGVYLLVMGPATAKQGRAVVSGLGNTRSGCDSNYVIDGVAFRLLQIPLGQTDLDDVAHLRNVLAYRCFGVDQATAPLADPFGAAPPPQGPLETLRAAKQLTACDVPLALIYWTSAGVQFIDIWPVRRRVTPPDGGGDQLGLLADWTQSEADARLLQFQQHIQSLRVSGSPPQHASDAFRWLPPAGLLPLGGIAGAVGFDSTAFFSGFTTRGPVFIEGARVRAFLRLASSFPPIIVGDPELVWLYLVRENRQPLNGVTPKQPYLLFAVGRLPCQMVPRYDVSHWNFANYALDDERIGL